ncbi:MAG TPA: cyclic lactone autoinducer peptide [Bacillota bacterium]|nr:cyclic lactone autoinducer peptide [Bacillota bacterium]
MKRLGASLIVTIATILAMLSICTACFIWGYQPELPQRPLK